MKTVGINTAPVKHDSFPLCLGASLQSNHAKVVAAIAKALAIVLFAFVLDRSASAQKCPIETGKQSPDVSGSNKFATPMLEIQFTNTSDKTIVGMKFRVSFFDATNDKHESPTTYNSDKKVKPAQKTTVRWDNVFWNMYSHDKMESEVVKILYSDGSTWEGDSSHACLAAGNLKGRI